MTQFGKVCLRRGNNIEAPETLIRKIVRTSHLPSQITLTFHQFRIACIDLDRRVYTTKRSTA